MENAKNKQTKRPQKPAAQDRVVLFIDKKIHKAFKAKLTEINKTEPSYDITTIYKATNLIIKAFIDGKINI